MLEVKIGKKQGIRAKIVFGDSEKNHFKSVCCAKIKGSFLKYSACDEDIICTVTRQKVMYKKLSIINEN